MAFGAGQIEVFAGLLARAALPLFLAVLAAGFLNQVVRLVSRKEAPFGFGVTTLFSLYVAIAWPALHGRTPMASLLLWPGIVLAAAMALAYVSPAVIAGSPFRIGETIGRLRNMRAGLVALIALSACYALAAPDPRLPVFSMGNEDVWYFAKMARIAVDPAANNLVDFDLLPREAAHTAPTTFVLLAGLALLTGSDVADILPVATILVLSLSLMLVKAIGERHCGLPSAPATLAAALWTVSGFSLYLSGHYFMPQQIGILCLLGILHVALADDDGPAFRIPMLVLLHYLMLMTYPSLFPVYLAIFLFTVATHHLLRARLGREKRPVGTLWASLLAPAAALLVFGILDPGHLAETVKMVIRFIDADHGWSLELINPIELVAGAAYPPDRGSLGGKLAGYGLVLILVIAGFAASVWTQRRALIAALWSQHEHLERAPDLARWATIVLVFLVAIAGYLACFAWFGPSYQQWKLAASAVFPLAFVPLAVAWRAGAAFWPGTWNSRWLLVPGLAMLALSIDASLPVVRFFAGAMDRYAPLRALQAVDGRADIVAFNLLVKNDRKAIKVAGQFVNRKPVNTLDGLDPPPGAKTVTLTNLCPILEQSTLSYLGGTFCSFERVGLRDAYEVSFAAEAPGQVEASGLARAEAWGAWSEGERTVLSLPVDPAWPAVAVRLVGMPFLVPGCASSQRLVFSVGQQRLGEVELSAEGQADLVIPGSLASGYILPLTIDFPDATSERACGAGDDRRQQAFGFQKVIVSRSAG